jgi:hypothetical protein
VFRGRSDRLDGRSDRRTASLCSGGGQTASLCSGCDLTAWTCGLIASCVQRWKTQGNARHRQWYGHEGCTGTINLLKIV